MVVVWYLWNIISRTTHKREGKIEIHKYVKIIWHLHVLVFFEMQFNFTYIL